MLTLKKFKTEKNADSIEFCPHEPNQNVFICANYELEKGTCESATQMRTGLLLLFTFTPSSDLILLQRVKSSGVLDVKWYHYKIGGQSIVAVVNSDKTIEIYKLTSSLQLEFITKFTIESKQELLLLALDWSNHIGSLDTPEIVCSDSDGCVHRLLFNNNQLTYLNGYKTHDFQCWSVGFNYFNPNIFYSGGDDAFFYAHDVGTGGRIFKNKSHTAGVTSIHYNRHKEHLLATGCYDGFLRLWDNRNLKNSLVDLITPDTLWRLKWDPFQGDYLLIACMSGGAHIVDVKENGTNANIIGSYTEHESLVYGVDWNWMCRETIKKWYGGCYLLGSCSFYDNLLCLSTFKDL